MTDDWKIIAPTEKREYFFPGDMPPSARVYEWAAEILDVHFFDYKMDAEEIAHFTEQLELSWETGQLACDCEICQRLSEEQ